MTTAIAAAPAKSAISDSSQRTLPGAEQSQHCWIVARLVEEFGPYLTRRTIEVVVERQLGDGTVGSAFEYARRELSDIVAEA